MMKKTLLRTITLSVFSCLIFLTNAYSQDDELIAAAPFSEDDVQPNYHYEYIPDLIYLLIDLLIDLLMDLLIHSLHKWKWEWKWKLEWK